MNYDENDIGKAIGRYGSIWVYDANYHESEYSMVKFVWQLNMIKMKNMEIIEKEGEGKEDELF